mmetsp:Transcript_52868/g.172040  ORF Transcript_52868/g.172040 Transcript_52868/m.172040 type:complete len:213 (+) Transcript_52868:168-806(+)
MATSGASLGLGVCLGHAQKSHLARRQLTGLFVGLSKLEPRVVGFDLIRFDIFGAAGELHFDTEGLQFAHEILFQLLLNFPKRLQHLQRLAEELDGHVLVALKLSGRPLQGQVVGILQRQPIFPELAHAPHEREPLLRRFGGLLGSSEQQVGLRGQSNHQACQPMSTQHWSHFAADGVVRLHQTRVQREELLGALGRRGQWSAPDGRSIPFVA